MNDRVGFALIGCGEIAVHTSRSILNSRFARVVRCMDIRGELAADLAGKHDAPHGTDLDEALADPAVQAVIISTPHWLHAPLAIAAARAGKHVLVEKPMACTLGEADEMIAAAGAAGVKLGVLLPVRRGYAQDRARRLVAAGAVGEVTAYQIHAMGCKPLSYWHGGFTGRAKDDWRMHLATSGGGFLVMNLIHNLDTMISVIDPRPERIYAEYATLNTPDVEVEDFISFVMRLAGGAVVSVNGSSAAPGSESTGDRIYGTRGQIVLNGEGLRVWLDEPHEEVPAGKWIELPAPDDWPDPRAECIDAFARAVLGDGEPVPDGPTGRRSLEIARGAYLSMQRGGPVSFPVHE